MKVKELIDELKKYNLESNVEINLTDKQREWLKEFIEIWGKAQDVESWLYEREVKDER